MVPFLKLQKPLDKMMCQLSINVFATRIKEAIILWIYVLLNSSACIYEKSENKEKVVDRMI